MVLVSFSALDWAIFGAFALAILALGFSAKLRNSSVFQFLTAGRSLSLPAFVATLVTFWYGGILGVSESVSYFGLGTWFLIGVPYYVFALIYAFKLASRVRGADEITIPERLERKWGKGVGLTSALLIFFLAVPAAHVLMLGVLLQSFTGLESTTAILIATLVGGAFLYRGGLLADVRVGFLAFIMMYVGFAVMLIYCATHFSAASAVETLQSKGLMDFFGGKGSLVALTFFIIGAWTLVDPGFHQRVASGKDVATSKRGVLISVLFWALFDFLSIATAMYAVALASPSPTDGKMIYPAFANQVLPDGIKAIFFCGMVGTILSACVGYSLVSGATVGREIIGRIKGDINAEKVTQWTRIGIFASILLAAFLARQIDSVVSLWYSWGGCIIGALLIPTMLAYFGNAKVGSGWIVASMSGAFVVSFSWLVFGLQTKNPILNVAIISGSNGISIRSEAESIEATKGRIDIPLGTMIPALVVSGGAIAIGMIAGRRKKTDG